jgi:hypothetical protein
MQKEKRKKKKKRKRMECQQEYWELWQCISSQQTVSP